MLPTEKYQRCFSEKLQYRSLHKGLHFSKDEKP